MADDFGKLDSIFRMLGPADLAGSVRFTRDATFDQGIASQLLEVLLATDARGVLSGQRLREKLGQLVGGAAPDAAAQFFDSIGFYSTAGYVDGTPASRSASRVGGATIETTSMKDVLGKGVSVPSGKDVTFVLSSSPFITPAVRDASKVELFLNAIPTLTFSRCVPYLDVEFQFDRSASSQLQTPGLLKFLMGSPKVDDLSSAEQAMVTSRRLTSSDGNNELDFAGMEMFTSPQTLINTSPLSDGTDGSRYAPVLDPMRPFATLESFEVTVRPTVGMYTYKSARMTLKLHDRSRLAEISDLIKPDVFTRTTLWATYGWRHPIAPDDPFAVFINSRMLVREAYGIVNSSFKFETAGQVTINLELFTRGVSELRSVKIAESPDGPAAVMREIKQLAEDVARCRKQLRLDPPEGLNREIRPFQVLDAAERGEFPDLKASDVRDAIMRLRKSLSSKEARIDQSAADDLVAALRKLYSADNAGKFDFKSRLENTTTAAVKRKFDELELGADPFLPTSAKVPNGPLGKLVDDYTREPSSTVSSVRKRVVSFAKLFAVFMVQPMLSLASADEVQVFFYAFNDQAGGVAGANIGEFPIDMPVFFDQYKEHIQRRGSESITVEEFLGLVVNSQIDDPRAIGYGMRRFFEPYDPKNKEPQVSKKMQGDYESALAAQSARMGPFKKPAIEVHIECVPEAHAREGEPDAYAALGLSVSARDDGTLADPRQGQARRILRIHVYDKQLNPYRAPAMLLRSEDGGSFIEVPSSEAAAKLTEPGASSSLAALRDLLAGIASPGAELSVDGRSGAVKLTRIGSNQQIKDAVSKLVPTITYGSNASAVISAELASKQDPLLSTVQMQRAGKQNATSPNGAGTAGLPLRIVPASLSMPTLGCPLVNLGQIFFVDFGTGTTADNLYILTGLTHALQPGKFETSWSMTFYDAYGRYEGAPNVIDFFKSGRATG
jgi:hypothetical protein